MLNLGNEWMVGGWLERFHTPAARGIIWCADQTSRSDCHFLAAVRRVPLPYQTDPSLTTQVIVVSDEFEGKPLLARHRMVNALFAEEMKGKVHGETQAQQRQ